MYPQDVQNIVDLIIKVLQNRNNTLERSNEET